MGTRPEPCMSLRSQPVLSLERSRAEVHLVPAKDFSSGRGRPTTAMPGASQRRSDEVSGGKDPRDGRSRSWIMRARIVMEAPESTLAAAWHVDRGKIRNPRQDPRARHADHLPGPPPAPGRDPRRQGLEAPGAVQRGDEETLHRRGANGDEAKTPQHRHDP